MKSTQKILVAGLILMVLLNIGTLGFILLKQRHPHRGGAKDGFHRGPGRMLDQLNFSDAQKEAAAKLRKEHEGKMTSLRIVTDSLRKVKFQLIKADVYDSSKANQLNAQIGDSHVEMEKQMSAHFLSVKALCTKEQLPEFNEFIDRLSERCGPAGMHQGGGRQGWDKKEGCDNRDNKGCR